MQIGPQWGSRIGMQVLEKLQEDGYEMSGLGTYGDEYQDEEGMDIPDGIRPAPKAAK